MKKLQYFVDGSSNRVTTLLEYHQTFADISVSWYTISLTFRIHFQQMKMANLCRLLTKMMPVSSHQNKHHVSRSNLPTPRELLPALPYFIDVMAQPALSVCPIALETTTSSEVSLAEWRFCFCNSPACQCYHLTFPQFTVLLATRLPQRTAAISC